MTGSRNGGQSGGRSYKEGCVAAHALDLIGDRWALLLVRELILGPRRFSELREGLPGISANVLTERLEEAISQGLILREPVPGLARSGVSGCDLMQACLVPRLRATSLRQFFPSSAAFSARKSRQARRLSSGRRSR